MTDCLGRIAWSGSDGTWGFEGWKGSDGTWFFEGKAYSDREWRGFNLPLYLRKKWLARRDHGMKENRKLVKEGKLVYS